MFAKSKLDSIKTLVSQALIDMEISHEEFDPVIRKKEKDEKLKENLRNVSKKQQNMRLNSVNSIKKKKKSELVTGDFDWLKDL